MYSYMRIVLYINWSAWCHDVNIHCEGIRLPLGGQRPVSTAVQTCEMLKQHCQIKRDNNKLFTREWRRLSSHALHLVIHGPQGLYPLQNYAQFWYMDLVRIYSKSHWNHTHYWCDRWPVIIVDACCWPVSLFSMMFHSDTRAFVVTSQ